MSTVHIEIAPNGLGGKFVIDGHDIAKAVTGFNVRGQVGHITQVELDLRAYDITTFEAPHVQVHVDPTAAGFLERAGWTPPPGVESVLERNADGCPCQWIDIWERSDGTIARPGAQNARMRTILGRTVPTCPIHSPHGTALHRARVEGYGQGRDDEAAGLPLRYGDH